MSWLIQMQLGIAVSVLKMFLKQVVLELPFNIQQAYLCKKHTEEGEKQIVSMQYQNTLAYFEAYCSKPSHARAFDI